jgi:Holliday junction resolvase RusA-like endonuclease
VVDDNAKSKPWKAEVRAVAVEAMGRRPLIEGPIHLEVVFLRPRPRGHFNARGDLNAAGRRMTYPTTKPDRTKLLRGLEDALTGLVWRDDAQVVAGNAWKDWGEPARTEVWISTI